MTIKIAVRLSALQADAIASRCAKLGVPLTMFLREAALRAIDEPHLGTGLVATAGELVVEHDGPVVIPVRVNERQHRALARNALRRGVPISALLRDEALEAVNAKHLASSGAIARLRAAVK
jgi:hypothetical protein